MDTEHIQLTGLDEVPPHIQEAERLYQIAAAVQIALWRAREQHAPMHSAHEAYAVILEELDEVKAQVWKKVPNQGRLRSELTHVAAMAMRAILDLGLEGEK